MSWNFLTENPYWYKASRKKDCYSDRRRDRRKLLLSRQLMPHVFDRDVCRCLSGGIKVSRWCSFCPCKYIADLVDTPFVIGIPFVLGISFTVGAESTSPIKLTSFNRSLNPRIFWNYWTMDTLTEGQIHSPSCAPCIWKHPPNLLLKKLSGGEDGGAGGVCGHHPWGVQHLLGRDGLLAGENTLSEKKPTKLLQAPLFPMEASGKGATGSQISPGGA